VRVAGRAFEFGGTLLVSRWTVRHWAGDGLGAWPDGPPLAEREWDRLDFAWGHGAPAEGVPADGFLTRATASLDLPEGFYEIRTTSDDGVRVLVDGIPVQSDWASHPPKENRTVLRLPPGTRTFAVEHFEIDGWAVLGFGLRRVADPGGYAGFYQVDARFLALRDAIPAIRDRAVARVEEVLGGPIGDAIEVVFEDGPWAHAEGGRVVLGTEALVLGAHDPEATLVHEIWHCHQQRRLGAAYASLPPWAREGAALYVAGQFEERARTLVASWEGPPDGLVAPLDDEGDDLRHYAGYAAAFHAAEARHGRAKAVALVRRLLETADARAAVREVLGEGFPAFAAATAEYARRRFADLAADGGEAMGEARQLLRRGEWQGAIDRLPRTGTYGVDAAYHRAGALHALGRPREALDALRAEFLPERRHSVYLAPAVLLELRLLHGLDDPEFPAAAQRARADLRPFDVYPELLRLLARSP
jgi:hypothetical protein